MPKKFSYLPILATISLLLFNPASNAATDTKPAPKGVSQKDVTAFNDGIKLLNDRDFQGAYDKFKPLSQGLPDFLDAHVMCGAALIQLGKPEEALAVLHNAEAINPNDGLMLFNLGTAYFLTGKRDRALEKLQKYVNLYPNEKYSSEAQARIDILTTEQARTKGIASSHGQDNYLDEAMAVGAVRWNASQMPIPVFIAPGTGIKGYREALADILKQAFTTWTEASQGKLEFKFVTDPADASIHCSWTDDASTLANPAEGGEALPMATLNGSMLSARIKIVTRKGSLTVLPDRLVRTICLHEVGHAIGILGHSSQPGDVMLAAFSESADMDLSDRDKKTVYLLYTAPDSILKEHPVKTTNAAYNGSNTSPANRAIRLNAQALEEMNKDHYDKAIVLLEEALKIAPEVDIIYINLAKAYNDLGNNAMHAHDQATVKKYYDLAITNLVKAKRKDLAVQYCDIMIRISNEDANAAEVLNYQTLKRQLAEKK